MFPQLQFLQMHQNPKYTIDLIKIDGQVILLVAWEQVISWKQPKP